MVMLVNDILKKDGLTIELLTELSYQSQLGLRLKKNLHYFDKKHYLQNSSRSMSGMIPVIFYMT
jgi:putative GTP pyrophosphokinase